MCGEAQLVPALLASQLKFSVELHFEEPRKESGTIRCRNLHFHWEQLSKELGCDYALRCCFWLLESAFWSHPGMNPVPCGLLSGKEASCHNQDEGVKEKYQSSGMWA